MNEATYLGNVEAAKNDIESWRLKIEREKQESGYRLQNIDNEIAREREMSDQRFHDFQAHINTATADDDRDAVDSWTTRLRQEERDLASRLERLTRSIDDEKRQSAQKISDYESEITKAEQTVKENVQKAVEIREGAEKKRKQAAAVEAMRLLTDDGA